MSSLAHGRKSAVVVAPVQWSRLKDIDEVKPLNDADGACLAEIRDVLKKHGNLDRFGIALLHSHFPLADDEVMLEETNEDARLQTLKPVKRSQMNPNNVGTIWALSEGDVLAMSVCVRKCLTNMYNEHRGKQVHERKSR